MARGINKVILVGNLGKDPETRFFPDGGAVTNITIATSESWKDKNTGEQQERTEWHRVAFRGRLAEIAGEYLKKGSKVYIEGKLQTEVQANEMQMLDSRNAGSGGSDDYNQSPQQGSPRQAPAAAKPQQNQYAPQPQSAEMSAGFDDDIPF